MLDWTDRHCRYLHRLIAPRALLYTEMVTATAVIHGDRSRLLGHDPREWPLALQLGGSDPQDLATAARLAEGFGFCEINLNVGCPSDRVQSGRFGACLMAEPELVAECAAAMQEAQDLPVTVKTRIGIDDSPDEGFLERFVEIVAAAGIGTFIIHARKAWLKGLSPKENREIPPLRYPVVHALKAARPDLEIIINGGIRDPHHAWQQLAHVDGVMIGREAYSNPMSLHGFETRILGDDTPERHPDHHEIVEAMANYAREQAASGVPVKSIARHMMGLFNARPGARRYRRHLSTGMHDRHAGPDLLIEAAAMIEPDFKPALLSPAHQDTANAAPCTNAAMTTYTDPGNF